MEQSSRSAPRPSCSQVSSQCEAACTPTPHLGSSPAGGSVRESRGTGESGFNLYVPKSSNHLIPGYEKTQHEKSVRTRVSWRPETVFLNFWFLWRTFSGLRCILAFKWSTVLDERHVFKVSIRLSSKPLDTVMKTVLYNPLLVQVGWELILCQFDKLY